jgi:AcrR family transcriptional regulator
MQILKDEIREKILQAARDEFFTAGYKQASTRKIIQRAKISNGNLYNYFKTKEELFSAVVEPLLEFSNALLQTLFTDEGIENFSPAQIELLCASICDMLARFRKEWVVLMNQSQGTPYEAYKTELIERLAEHFQKNAKPEFKSSHPRKGMLMQLAATNIVEGILKIAAQYPDQECDMKNIRLLFLYHIHGIAQFYPQAA